ncbi:uncharacterized protein LOC119610378 [Lucilia sericata]|uniref:uncharacterized protein LOC119610378 n=1 Tax=Lucilia sericata TaxID=13632 RepID=UPI0018A82EB2|nr:uncharacterized protein LOC119610378 [Lucilia sericata]
MRNDDIDEVTKKIKIGDRLIFKYQFENWKDENCTPSLARRYMKQSSDNTSSSSFLSSQSSDEMDSTPAVIDILKQHKVGCNIVEQYEKLQLLTEHQRIIIMNIIVEYFYSRNITMTLQISYRLEKEILKIFPREKLEFYRTERRGRIYIKYHNNKNKLKMYENEAKSSTAVLEAKDKFVPEDNAQICMQSLKYDNLTAEDFKATWSACAKFRLSQIHVEAKNINEALVNWPQYRGPIGSQLMDLDFKVLQEKYSTIAESDEKLKKIFNYLKSHETIYNNEIKNVVNSLQWDDIEKDKNGFLLKILWCVHYFLPPTKKFLKKDVNGKKDFGKFSLKNSQESFIYINETMQSLEDHTDFLIAKGIHASNEGFSLSAGDLLLEMFSTIPMDLDFKVLQEKYSTIAESDEKLKKIFNYLKSHETIYNNEIKNVVNSLQWDDIEKDKNGFLLKILWCVHYFLPPTKKFLKKDVNGKKDFGKFSLKNSQESFIYINETMQSLEDHTDFLIAKV